jgi:hypothetical protein
VWWRWSSWSRSLVALARRARCGGAVVALVVAVAELVVLAMAGVLVVWRT